MTLNGLDIVKLYKLIDTNLPDNVEKLIDAVELREVVKRMSDSIFSFATTPIIEFSRNTPPGVNSSGDTYVVGELPTGAWVGYSGQVVIYTTVGTPGWVNIEPVDRMSVLVKGNPDIEYRYHGSYPLGTWEQVTLITDEIPKLGVSNEFTGLVNSFINVYVAGNIAVSGTVDGRDVSVDGAKLDTTVVGPASSVDNSIPVFDGVTGKLLKDNTGVSIVSGNIVGSNSSFVISTDSADGADNKRLQLSAANTTSTDRGGYIDICGNEYTGQEGNVRIIAGNSTSGKIRLYTGAGVERMQLEKGGNLGLGTGALGAALGKVDISNGAIGLVVGADEGVDTRTNSTTKLTRIGMPHYTNAEEPITLIRASAEVADNRVMIGGGTGTMNAATQISFYTAANNTTVTGTERMKIDYSGRVGMGTAAIGATLGKLDISSGNIALVLGADSSAETRTDNTMKYSRIGSANYVNAEEPFSLIGGISNASNNEVSIGGGTSLLNSATILRFYTGSYNTTAGTQRMLINSVGNVGIGTNTPGAKLDISNGGLGLLIGADSNADTRTNSVQKVARICSPHCLNAEEPCALMHCVSESTYTNLNIGGGTGTMNAITRLGFFTAPNNTTVTGTERMCILTNGNVGVNKAVPTEKLDVDGNIAVSGTINNELLEIATGFVQKKFVKELNLLNLNEEVTIATIPSGKRAFFGEYNPNFNAWVHEHTGTMTGNAVITVYFTPIGASEANITFDVTGANYYGTPTIAQLLEPNTTVRVKVTTAATGSTVAKLGLWGFITY